MRWLGFLDHMLDISWNVFRIPPRMSLPLGAVIAEGLGEGPGPLGVAGSSEGCGASRWIARLLLGLIRLL